MTIPQPLLPPPSQPWGRWISAAVQRIDSTLGAFQSSVNNSLRQLNISRFQPMRALITRQTSGTVTISTAGVYVPINLSATLDTDVSFNMVASGAPNVTGLKNITDQTRTMVFIATYDGKGGNNHAIGLKLALNNVPIDASECTSFSGGSGQFCKVMTQYMLKMEPNDEVTMWAANIDATTNVSIQRLKLLAHAVL